MKTHIYKRNQYEIMTFQLISQKYYDRIYHTFPFKFPEKIRKRLSIIEGFKKNNYKMVGLIHSGWLAGGQNPTKNNIVLKKNTKMIRMA